MAFRNRISWKNQVSKPAWLGQSPRVIFITNLKPHLWLHPWEWRSGPPKATSRMGLTFNILQNYHLQTQPANEDFKSLSHKPGLLFEHRYQLVITSPMSDKTRRHCSPCCSASLLRYRCFHAHPDAHYRPPLRPRERWASQGKNCTVKWPVHAITYTAELF